MSGELSAGRAPDTLHVTPSPEEETEALQGAQTGPESHGLRTLFYFLSSLSSLPALAQLSGAP